MNPTAIFSKIVKGVQEASGKTSELSRSDRAILKEIDGKTVLASIATKLEKTLADKFYALIAQFDKDGYIREVSSGAQTAAAAPPARSAAPAKAPPSSGSDDDMDFTQAIKLPPKAPPVDLAAASHAEAERKEKEQQAFDYKARQEAGLRAKAQARAQAEAKVKADAEVRAKALAEAKARTEAEAKAKAEARAAYAMSGPKPATLFESARIQGEFKIEQGVLGSFDLTRALQTGGAQSSGRTIFTELTGQAVYKKGTVKITNAAISVGAMNAGANLDIDAGGGLSGRVVADVKTPSQTMRATLNISGKIQDPVIRK